MSEERCENCRFFEYHSDGEVEPVPARKKTGSCHRYPPTLSHAQIAHFVKDKKSTGWGCEDADKDAWVMPIVIGSDWCGEFQLSPLISGVDDETGVRR